MGAMKDVLMVADDAWESSWPGLRHHRLTAVMAALDDVMTRMAGGPPPDGYLHHVLWDWATFRMEMEGDHEMREVLAEMRGRMN
jgi:hypothetical protein